MPPIYLDYNATTPIAREVADAMSPVVHRRAGSVVEDPEGPEERTSHVLRGGSFYDLVSRVRCAARESDDPYYRSGRVGFRLLLCHR